MQECRKIDAWHVSLRIHQTSSITLEIVFRKFPIRNVFNEADKVLIKEQNYFSENENIFLDILFCLELRTPLKQSIRQ
jgi:hypothetical protein